MTTFKQLQEEREKEFAKLLAEKDAKLGNYFKSVYLEDFEGGYPMDIYTDTQSFYHESMKAVLEWVVEKIRKTPIKFPERESDEYDGGYSRALSVLKSHLEEAIKELK